MCTFIAPENFRLSALINPIYRYCFDPKNTANGAKNTRLPRFVNARLRVRSKLKEVYDCSLGKL